MSDVSTKPFTKGEIAAIRRAFRNEENLWRDLWAKVKSAGKRVPFLEDILAAYFCAVDPTTSRRVKLILFGAIAYFIFPLDAFADFLPVFGFADDAALLAAALTQVAGSVTEAHRVKAREALQA